jgi:transcriptional regulator with XRE-family HTH domain
MLSIAIKPPGQILVSLGARAKKSRLRMNWSRKTLAERSGVPESTIKRFELTGLIGTSGLVDLALALDRGEEMDKMFTHEHVPSIREIDSANRQRGRS